MCKTLYVVLVKHKKLIKIVEIYNDSVFAIIYNAYISACKVTIILYY